VKRGGGKKNPRLKTADHREGPRVRGRGEVKRRRFVRDGGGGGGGGVCFVFVGMGVFERLPSRSSRLEGGHGVLRKRVGQRS